MTQTQKLAQNAKANGIKYVALVINQKYNTRYFRIRSIDTIIEHGRNLNHNYEGGYHSQNTKGVTYRNLPDNTLIGYAALKQFA